MGLERLLWWRVRYPNHAISVSCQKRFMCTHKEADLGPHPVTCCVLKVGGTEKFLREIGFESLDSFFQSQQVKFLFHSRSSPDVAPSG